MRQGGRHSRIGVGCARIVVVKSDVGRSDYAVAAEGQQATGSMGVAADRVISLNRDERHSQVIPVVRLRRVMQANAAEDDPI